VQTKRFAVAIVVSLACLGQAASALPVRAASQSSRTYASISGGDSHTCALTSDGKAYCWGSNSKGELGDGTTTASGTSGPRKVIGGHTFRTIDVGYSGSCAITTRGKAYCWGDNTGGENGDGTIVASGENGPQKVIGGHTFVRIAVGEMHVCALTQKGAAYCWGYNWSGMLGDGTTNNSVEGGPVKVLGNHKFVTITVGEDFSCGLTARGTTYCWGANGEGMLGDGTLVDSGLSGPRKVIGGHKFTYLHSGEYVTCGLTASQRAYCWGGQNNHGALGDGTTIASGTAGPQRVIGGHRFTSINNWGYFTCALTPAGAAYCWGDNANGELGNGTLVSSDGAAPVKVLGNHTFKAIGPGEDHTCALTVEGKAYCWGANGSGQLGDRTLSSAWRPKLVIDGVN